MDSLSSGPCREGIMTKWTSSNSCNCWGWDSRLHCGGEACHFRGRNLWSEIWRMRRAYLGQSIREERVQGREYMNSKFEKFEETQSYWDVKWKEGKKEGWRDKQWPNNPASCKKRCWTFSKNNEKTLKVLSRKISRLNLHFRNIIQSQVLEVDQSGPVKWIVPYYRWETARKVTFSLDMKSMKWRWTG